MFRTEKAPLGSLVARRAEPAPSALRRTSCAFRSGSPVVASTIRPSRTLTSAGFAGSARRQTHKIAVVHMQLFRILHISKGRNSDIEPAVHHLFPTLLTRA